MTFDEKLKQIIGWNAKVFYHQMVSLNEKQGKSKEDLMEFEICKTGYLTNKSLLAALSQMTFMNVDGGTEEAAAEQELISQITEGVEKERKIDQGKNDEVDWLNKLYLLGEEGKIKEKNGIKGNFNYGDWYKQYLERRKSKVHSEGGNAGLIGPSGSESQEGFGPTS